MKKILILTNSSSGLYNFRNELISKLNKEFEVVTSTPINGRIDELQSINCRLIETEMDRRGINPLKDFQLFIKYIIIIKRESPKMVITYTIKPNVYGGLVCRLLNIPYASNVTGLGTAFQNTGILKRIVIYLYKMGLKDAKIVFFENAENQNIFVENKIINHEKSCLLNGAGVNLERYPYLKYPTKDGVTRFLFIGRVMKEKGIDELFEAMDKLYAENRMVSLDVLGGLEEAYDHSIREYERIGWLHYHGYQIDVRPFIANSHCFILPSWHEGMANTNLECAASGRPIITSNIHGCKESVIENETGFLCEKCNADDLYKVMKKFTSLTREQQEILGLKGRKYVEEVFDKNKVVDITIAHLLN